jgi:hypothetical protein
MLHIFEGHAFIFPVLLVPSSGRLLVVGIYNQLSASNYLFVQNHDASNDVFNQRNGKCHFPWLPNSIFNQRVEIVNTASLSSSMEYEVI